MADVGIRGRRPIQRDEPPIIELEMLDTRPVPARTSVPRGPRRPTRWWVLAVPAVVLVVAIVAAVQGRRSPQSLPVVPPSTASPATTGAPAPTISLVPAPTGSLASTGSVAPTTTLRPPSTTAPVVLGPGPVLGTAHGWVVVGFNGEWLTILDLDTGNAQTFTYDAEHFRGDLRAPIVLTDRIVYPDVAAGVSSVWSWRFGDQPATLLVDHATLVARSSIPGKLWVELDPDGDNSGRRVAEIDGDGRASTTLRVPDGLRVIGAGTNGLWLSGSGRIYSLTRAGALLAIAVGTVVDVSVSGVIFDDCAISGPCSLRLAGTTPAPVLVGPSSELHPASAGLATDPALSPDGRWLLLGDGVLDRRTGGRLAHPFILQSWRWSPDSQWLFVWTSNYDLIVWNVVDGRQINLGGRNALSGVVAR